MMLSDKATIEEAVQDFNQMRSFAPYKFGGNWFIAKTKDGFVTYRTKKAAVNNSIEPMIWKFGPPK